MQQRQVFENLAVRVPPDAMLKLRRLKLETGKSLNTLVVEALQAYIEQQRTAGGSSVDA